LSFHGPEFPPAFHVLLTEEFSAYVAWLRDQNHFGGRSEPADDDDAGHKVEEEKEIFRDI